MTFGINYHPSHLIKLGIDYPRFLQENITGVYHFHGKDTKIIDQNLYEHGHELPATFADRFAHCAHSWRYTIPGQGLTRRWKLLRTHEENGYIGYVCIELEDANFHHQSTTQHGILQGAR